MQQWPRARTSAVSVLLAGATLFVASCASFPAHRQEPRNTVTVAEPEIVEGGPDIGTQPEPAAQSDLLLGISRLTANDGHWNHLDRSSPTFWYDAGCRRMGVDIALSLFGGDAFGSALGFAIGAAPRLFLGLPLDRGARRDGGVPGLCTQRRFNSVPGRERIAQLAPGFAGRDTSLLFTTARPGMPGSGGGSESRVGAILDQFVPSHRKNEGGPRTTGAARTRSSH